MKKAKMLGSLLTFAALVASGITFSGKFDKKVANADEIPEDQLHFELAGITAAHTYSNDPTQEPKYKGTVNYYNQNDPNSTSYSFAGKDTPFGRMNVASTWNSYRGESVKVAVIDTGCYYSHEEFANTNFVSCKNIYSNTTGLSNVNDGHGHGTTSAAMIAASINNVGSVGIAPNVELVILKCSNDSGAFSNSAVLDALQYCIDNDVDVVNMSIQGYSSSFSSTWTEDFGNLSTTQTSTGIMSSSYCESKINACYEAGITVVAAAGNYNTSTPSYPAANDHVIAVASTGLTEANKLNKAGYSNYGSWIDICAPGYVFTPTKTGTSDYTVNYGTSFSAPLVTGAIALYKSKYPYAKPDQIEKALKETATSVNWQGGAGAINVGAFLNYVPVEEISVSEDNVSVQMGSSYTLQPSVLPQGAIQTVTYESSDESVCTVNSSGVITPVSTGEAVIQITSSDYEEISKLVYVEVVSGTTSVYKTVNFTSSTMGSVSSYTSSFTVTDDGVTATVNNGNNNANSWDYVKFGPKNKTSTGLITNTTSIDKKITQIDLSFSQVSYVTSAKLYVSSSSSFANATEIAFTPQAGTTSINISSPIANGYYKIEISINNTSGTNGVVWLTKIEYYADSGTTPTPVTNYTVSFNANGGTGTMSDATTSGTSYTTPSCSFTYSGYTFNKWALGSSSGSKYSIGETITGISGNITLYATWTSNSASVIDDNYGNYYQPITSDLEGSALKTALHNLNDSKRTQTMGYDALKTLGKYTEQDWTGSANVSGKMFGFYDNALIADEWDNQATWNREHVWPNSLGGGSVDGDMHMTRPASVSINSSRGNKYYGSGSSNYDPGGTGLNEYYRGVAARIIFYCAIANTSLNIVDQNSQSTSNTMGKLSDLLQWNLTYAPDTSSNAALALRIEQNRNKVIYSRSGLQGNRNPFIDHPEYACKIWGTTNSTTRSICGLSGETLTLSQSSASLETGDTLVLTATASGGSGSVGWTTSNSSVASLSTNSGNSVTITAGSTGTATITATYGSLTRTCSITVSSSGGIPVDDDSETIVFSEQGYSNQQVISTVNGSNFSVSFDKGSNNNSPKYYDSGSSVRTYGGNTFTVSSSTKTIIKIELTFGSGEDSNTITTDKTTYSNGTWTGSASSVTFTIGGSSGHRRISSIKVTYEDSGGSQEPKVNSISIPSTLSLDLNGNASYTFSPTIDADEGADTTVTWESSNTSVAQITSGGQVTALSTGQTTITATCGDKTAQCTVTVVDTTPISVTGVSLNKSATSISVGSTETLTATITPSNATNKNVTWTSSSTNVATVSNGTVTAVAVGTTVITVRTADGGYTDTCTVTVTAAPTITYQLEADDSELKFNSGTNHVYALGVKVYQYVNGVKGDMVKSDSVNVDTSSLGIKTVQYTYNATVYSTTIKVTNNGTTYSEPTPTPHTATFNLSNDSGKKFSTSNKTVQGWTVNLGGTTNVETSGSGSSGYNKFGSSSSSFSSLIFSYSLANDAQVSSVSIKCCRSNTALSTNLVAYTLDSNNNKIYLTASGGTTIPTGTSVGSMQEFTFTPAANTTHIGTVYIGVEGSSGGKQLYVNKLSCSYTTYAGASNDFTLLEQAQAWARFFVQETRTEDVCLAELDSVKLAGLQSKWANFAYEYLHMVSGAKDEFCTSNDATIVEARNHYLYIVSKFGASNLGTDGAFVKNSQNQVLSAKANNPLVFLKGNSSIPIIVIMSVISVTSIGLFFYLRKRKEE